MMVQIWSCGGGTQSAAIAALIIQGRLPKPDYAAIVDTNREKTSTWRYMDCVLKPALAAVGVDLQRIDSSQYKTVDLYAENGSLLLPVFTNQSGEIGKLPGYCSELWKKRVLQRWAREQGLEKVTCWMGISTNEIQRVRTSDALWWQLRYPLIFEIRHSRHECIARVESMGWPPPPRSACWNCPNQRDAEWKDLKENDPADFAQAVALDKSIRDKDPYAFLHETCMPLEQVDFTEHQATLFDRACTSGYCWT